MNINAMTARKKISPSFVHEAQRLIRTSIPKWKISSRILQDYRLGRPTEMNDGFVLLALQVSFNKKADSY